jgi:hypothetical protein
MHATIYSHVAHETAVLCAALFGATGSGSRRLDAGDERDAGLRCRTNA